MRICRLPEGQFAAIVLGVLASFAIPAFAETPTTSLEAHSLPPLLDREDLRLEDVALRPDGVVLATDGKEHLVFVPDQIKADSGSAAAAAQAQRPRGTMHVTINRYFSPSPLRLTTNGSRALLADQWIDLDQQRLLFQLHLAETYVRSPHPQPLDLSPDGQQALLLVRSFHAADLNALAMFNLETGRPTHHFVVGDSLAGAAFAGEGQLALVHRSGRITLADFQGREVATLRQADVEQPLEGDFVLDCQIVHREEGSYLLVHDLAGVVVIDLRRSQRVLELEKQDLVLLDHSGQYLIIRPLPRHIKSVPPPPLEVRRLPQGEVIAHISGLGWLDVEIADLHAHRLYSVEGLQTLRPWRVEWDDSATSQREGSSDQAREGSQ
ncbi:MAG: hypothetical protein WD534_11075 [Phycisphaeraceae bacterium]